MVVNNAQNETAVVIRRDGQTVVFVRLRAGKLACERITDLAFRETWAESPHPLAETLDRFLEHGQLHGATQEALRGLNKLRERARLVVSGLF